jgi:hypothetical protein
MAMRFCQNCGTGHECEAETGGRTDPAVEIARIEAERDVKVAQIGARQDKAWNETRVEVAELEAEAEVAAAVAGAEVVGAAIEAGIQPEPEPVIIDAPEAIADDAPDDAPPEVEGSEPPAAKRKTVGLGAW